MNSHTTEGLMQLVSEFGQCRWSEGTYGASFIAKGQERGQREEAAKLYEEIRSYATALCQQAPATKDEALRVAREALERAESAMNYTQATVSPGNQRDRKGAWVEVHGGRAESSYRQLQLAIGATRSALRTIALAGEGPSVRMLSPAEHFAIDLREPVRIADIEAVQRKFCEVNGLRIAPAIQHPSTRPRSVDDPAGLPGTSNGQEN